MSKRTPVFLAWTTGWVLVLLTMLGTHEVNEGWGLCEEVRVGHLEFEVPLRHLSGNV